MNSPIYISLVNKKESKPKTKTVNMFTLTEEIVKKILCSTISKKKRKQKQQQQKTNNQGSN